MRRKSQIERELISLETTKLERTISAQKTKIVLAKEIETLQQQRLDLESNIELLSSRHRQFCLPMDEMVSYQSTLMANVEGLRDQVESLKEKKNELENEIKRLDRTKGNLKSGGFDIVK